jgi:hypothetical protein
MPSIAMRREHANGTASSSSASAGAGHGGAPDMALGTVNVKTNTTMSPTSLIDSYKTGTIVIDDLASLVSPPGLVAGLAVSRRRGRDSNSNGSSERPPAKIPHALAEADPYQEDEDMFALDETERNA